MPGGKRMVAVGFLTVSVSVAATAAMLAAPPIQADMMGNAFLTALTNAGISYNQATSATALGQSVCPMVVQPGASFDGVASKMAEGNGLSRDKAKVFTIIAIATYCPAIIAPLLPNRLQA
ncbi:MAG: DUF732 domain-containing protein [Mycobacterium sp.]|uniref:DUF732 domain-containing protein n=1 Tax=Mycobacterium sp. TaxID=1785 RepID=UPI001EC1FEDB|nr:DUF732 domain-containing protein [Mycobacterium sp.]